MDVRFNKIDVKGLEPRVEHDQYGRINNVWASAESKKGLNFVKQAVLSHISYNVDDDEKNNVDSCLNSTKSVVSEKDKLPSTESLL